MPLNYGSRRYIITKYRDMYMESLISHLGFYVSPETCPYRKSTDTGTSWPHRKIRFCRVAHTKAITYNLLQLQLGGVA